jgi:hypothetical protein
LTDWRTTHQTTFSLIAEPDGSAVGDTAEDETDFWASYFLPVMENDESKALRRSWRRVRFFHVALARTVMHSEAETLSFVTVGVIAICMPPQSAARDSGTKYHHLYPRKPTIARQNV